MNARSAELTTACRRRVIVGRFGIPATPEIGRVVLRIDPDDECHDTVWTSLTADEAVLLAHALLAEAAGIRTR